MIKASQIKLNEKEIMNIFEKFNVKLNEKKINFFLSEILNNISIIKNTENDDFFEHLYFFENHK